MKVVVIGAGIVGVSAALSLVEGGAEVVVLDRGAVAGEASGLNAGVIGGGGWGDRPDIEVALKMGSRDRYLDLAERGHGFGLELTGTLSLIRTEAEWALAAGLVGAGREVGHVVELLSGEELRALEPAADPSLLGAVFDPLGARAEPVAATQAFAAEATAGGATMVTGCEVTALTPAAGGGWEVRTEPPDSSLISADAVVLAAGPWCADLGALVGLDIPVVAVRGQMWATAPQSPMLGHAISAMESTLAWHDETPAAGAPPNLTHAEGRRVTRHLYGRQRANGEIVFGGDRVLTDDRTVDDDGIAVNHRHVGELLPPIASLAPVRTWAGLMPFSLDGRPLIGPLPDRPGLHLAAGLASSGFGRGPMTGQLIAEVVLGRPPSFDLTDVLPGSRVHSSLHR